MQPRPLSLDRAGRVTQLLARALSPIRSQAVVLRGRDLGTRVFAEDEPHAYSIDVYVRIGSISLTSTIEVMRDEPSEIVFTDEHGRKVTLIDDEAAIAND